MKYKEDISLYSNSLTHCLTHPRATHARIGERMCAGYPRNECNESMSCGAPDYKPHLRSF